MLLLVSMDKCYCGLVWTNAICRCCGEYCTHCQSVTVRALNPCLRGEHNLGTPARMRTVTNHKQYHCTTADSRSQVVLHLSWQTILNNFQRRRAKCSYRTAKAIDLREVHTLPGPNNDKCFYLTH